MLIENKGQKCVAEMHEVLLEERRKNLEHIFIYEPDECFSVNHGTDLSFVKDPEAFWLYMRKKTIPLFSISRGGGIIWHGPGQAILASVLNLGERGIDLTQYRECLEQAILNTLSKFGISGILRDYTAGSRGVWVEDPQGGELKKIAFIGFNCSGGLPGIAIHGCAINVSPDLYPFSLIYPCNLDGVEAISIKDLLGPKAPSSDSVGEILATEFRNIIETYKKVRI